MRTKEEAAARTLQYGPVQFTVYSLPFQYFFGTCLYDMIVAFSVYFESLRIAEKVFFMIFHGM